MKNSDVFCPHPRVAEGGSNEVGERLEFNEFQSLKLTMPQFSKISVLLPLLAGFLQPLMYAWSTTLGDALGSLFWAIAVNYACCFVLVAAWALPTATTNPTWQESWRNCYSFMSEHWWHFLILSGGAWGSMKHAFGILTFRSLGPNVMTGSNLAGQIFFFHTF
eukprot:Gregarina_sp_Poly_1__3772@NODE_2119_length_2648_cov_136_409919_g188_i2_p2_GENE_NODE_2119_length_2648_cov_136_409919_g188_i2NODE_2119_length_2648_cov_136_409919_g188_i2_p2_ORF_typecomplete_len163_score19_11DMT_YdcZ/PF04657_13/2_6e10Ion_trans/PF00520_31/0_014_NODE_2119_length_2648_cov_136_409919_g188_i25591047